MTTLSKLPSVEQLLQTEQAEGLINAYGRPLTVNAIRTALQKVRADVARNNQTAIPDHATLLGMAASFSESWTQSTLLPVINASGVILHTNLGRAPLSASAIQAMRSVSEGYSNLEFDLDAGKRGSRLIHAEAVLKRLTGAEAALVVNNNAAAVLLVLSALASRRQVIIARSQLVEIGGGFRVPDVMKQSGAKLVEVGTTNKVRLKDYQDAISPATALMMHAHRSNFKIIGFTEEPEWEAIVAEAHENEIPCLDDLGSGALLDTSRFGLNHEPTVQESLHSGSDLVCFSGDKLLGGPQAGIIIGKAGLIDKVKKHPLARAVRADKLCLAALSATLLHYLKDEATATIPIWRMIAAKPAEIKKRAKNWSEFLGQGEVRAAESTVGGGSLPGDALPTHVLALTVQSSNRIMEALRHGQPPVIARTEDGQILFDPRTVLPEQEKDLLQNVRMILDQDAARSSHS